MGAVGGRTESVFVESRTRHWLVSDHFHLLFGGESVVSENADDQTERESPNQSEAQFESAISSKTPPGSVLES